MKKTLWKAALVAALSAVCLLPFLGDVQTVSANDQ